MFTKPDIICGKGFPKINCPYRYPGISVALRFSESSKTLTFVYNFGIIMKTDLNFNFLTPSANIFCIVKKFAGKLLSLSGKGCFMEKKPSYEELTQRISVLEKKNAEYRLLRESQSRYQDIFERTKNGIAVYRAVREGEDFIFADFNKAAEKIENIGRKELIGKNVTGIFPEIKKFGLLNVFQRVWKTGCPEHHPISMYVDKRIRGWRENFVYKLSSGEIVTIYNDRTKEKQAEDALRESEERLRQVVENMPVMLNAFDENRQILVWNRECEKVTGYTAREMMGNPDALKLLYPDPEYRNGLIAEWERSGNEFANWEIRLTCREGNEKIISWSNISGQFPIPTWDFWAVGVDVTQRAHAEESLRKSEAQKRAMLDGIKINLAFVDNNLKILWVNMAAAISKGKRPEEMIGYKCHELWADPEKPCENCPTSAAFRTKTSEHAIIHTPDGKIWSERGEPVFDDQGKLVGVLEIAEDITDKVWLEEQLRHTHKMEAIVAMAGGIAHQFNNALFSVIGNLDLLKIVLGDDHKANKHIKSINASAQRMANLTRQLTTYAHGGKYHPHPVLLGKVVENTLSSLRPNLSPSVRIITELAADIPYIEMDEHQMGMVIGTIINNAAEAIDGSGYIRVSVEKKRLYREQSGGTGIYICLSVEDNGKGMDAETKRRIFDPFFSTKFQGRGLGMAAVYGIITNHDGYISIDSVPGQGTVVHVHIPV